MMRNATIYTVLFYTLLLFASCKKEEEAAPQPEPPVVVDSVLCDLGTVRIRENGNWKSLNVGSCITLKVPNNPDTLLSIEYYEYLSPLVIHQTILVAIPFKTSSVYPIRKLATTEYNGFVGALSSVIVDLDQPAARYEPDSSFVNQVELVKIDKEKQTVQGKFQMVVIDPNPQLSYLPDTIKITEGVFHVRYEPK